MADPVLTVERVPAPPDKHPMAAKSGLAMLVSLLEADKVWSACTKAQRTLLATLCPPVAEQLLELRELTAEQMPILPDEVRSTTRAALHKRGLVDDVGRLTGKAVHAWYYAGRLKANGGGRG